MPEQLQKEIKLVDPFVKKVPTYIPFPDGEKLVCRVKTTEISEETKSLVPVFEFVDLTEEIAKCQGLAGLDLMKTLLAQGKAKPEDFYDDGRSGVDVTAIPSDIHAAKAAAEAGQQQFAELAKALGVEDGEALTAQQLEKALTAYIAKAVSEQTKAADAPASEVKTNE